MELILDTEQTTWDKGDPFQSRNTLTCVSVAFGDNDDTECLPIEHDDFVGAGRSIARVKELLSRASVVVGHNLKRDLLWLRKYDIWSPFAFPRLQYFDTQHAEFLLSGQQATYSKLEDLGAKYQAPVPKGSLEVYWDAGINTNEIPLEALTTYAVDDARITKHVCHIQRPLLQEYGLEALFELEMRDMITLNEMEYNGVLFALDQMRESAGPLREELKSIDETLNQIVGSDRLNWNSPKHISAVLFGGSVPYVDIELAGVYKTGLKAGQPKFKKVTYTLEFPRLCEPVQELATQGQFSTNESDLKTVRARTKDEKARFIIDKLEERALLGKLLGTYLEGIPDKAAERGWTDGIVHGKYNQSVARTGRLSSSDPNMQNLDARVKQYIQSRFQ